MNAARPAEILRQLEQTGAPDRDLLARFVASRDSAAFAELVRRHGPLVLGVCRRVTGQAQDAEDAFQATFLVLAKKAGSLRNPELLGNYLYGVAFRVASRALRSALRRGKREVLVSALPDPLAPSPPPAMSELTPILDEELAALPACYRDAIVLCDLRGQSREVAAAALGVPEGTLSSRLASGRKKLAARLTRRGVTLSAALLPVVLTEATAQAVPTELITKTCGLVANWAGGTPVPLPLARLAEGGFTVRKMLVFGVLMVASVAGAVFAAAPRDESPPPDPPQPPAVVAKPADALQPKGEAKPVAYRNNPRKHRAVDLDRTTGLSNTQWNTTGTHLAVAGEESIGPQEAKKTRRIVWIIAVNPDVLSLYCYPGEKASLVAVEPDGKTVLTDLREYSLISGHHQLKWWGDGGRFGGGADRLGEKKSVDLDLPETRGYAFSADGKTFRTVAWLRDANGAVKELEVLEADATTGKAGKSLLKTDFTRHVLAPNGKRFAVLDKDYKKVTVYDLDRGAKQFEATIAEEKFADLHGIVSNPFGGSFSGMGGSGSKQASPVMVFSPDARRLVVSRSIGQTVVLNAETGDALPVLEGLKEARIVPDAHCFSGDGRLLAASGTMYKLGTQRGPGPAPGGKGPAMQTVWEQGAGFLTVWDTQTGKAVKSWNRAPQVAFNPTKPMLAILEGNGDSGTRVGFWDFAAEAAK